MSDKIKNSYNKDIANDLERLKLIANELKTLDTFVKYLTHKISDTLVDEDHKNNFAEIDFKQMQITTIIHYKEPILVLTSTIMDQNEILDGLQRAVTIMSKQTSDDNSLTSTDPLELIEILSKKVCENYEKTRGKVN